MGFNQNSTFGFGSNGSGGGGGGVAAANNGLSLVGSTVVLGQTVGQSGNPANLLSPREIPMNGNTLQFTGDSSTQNMLVTSDGRLVFSDTLGATNPLITDANINIDGFATHRVTNSSAGVSAIAGFTARNNGHAAMRLLITSNGYNDGGVLPANFSAIEFGGDGLMVTTDTGGAGPITFSTLNTGIAGVNMVLSPQGNLILNDGSISPTDTGSKLQVVAQGNIATARFTQNAAKTIIVPDLEVYSSGGVLLTAMRFSITSATVANFLMNTTMSASYTATDNVFIGHNVGAANTTGTANQGIGAGVLAANTTGSDNLGIGGGNPALAANTTGTGNIALGTDALSHNTTGGTNIGIGVNPLIRNTTGVGNIAIGGGGPLARNILGSHNIAIGGGALNSQLAATDTLSGAIAIGFGAGQQLTPGTDDILIGVLCGFNYSGTSGNVIIGQNSMSNSTTTVSDNTLIGGNILPTAAGVIGSGCTLLGAKITFNVPITNTTVVGSGISVNISNVAILGRADQNVIIGTTASPTDNGAKMQVIGATDNPIISTRQFSGKSASTPDMIFYQSDGSSEAGRITFLSNFGGDAGSIFIGSHSGITQGAPHSATVVGFRSAQLDTTGHWTALGYEVGVFATTGERNTGIGIQALHNITTGNDNIGIGQNGILGATILNRNIAIGNFAGSGSWGGLACDDNVMIGFGAGTSVGAVAFTATKNTILGNGALAAANGGYTDQNIVIGYNAINTGQLVSNNIIIGASTLSGAAISNSTVIGTGITVSISNIAIFGRADQNVVIGTTASPTDNGAKLQIIGDFTTAAPITGNAGKWKLGQFDNNPATPTARIKVNVDAVDYWVPAQVA